MSQNFDLSPPDDPDIQQWMPQASTNEFDPPHFLSFGQENDQYHIELTFQLDMADMLKIAFDHFIINNTKYTIHPITHVISLHVPTTMFSSSPTRTTVHVVLQNRSNHQNIMDSWFVTDFIVTNRKRTSTDYSQGYEVKRQRSITGITSGPTSNTTTSTTTTSNTANTVNTSNTNTNTNTTTTSSMPEDVQNPFMPSYYGLPNPPYVGLPPTQPSPRPSREFFHDDAMLYPFRSPDFQYDSSFVSPIQNPMMMQQPVPPPPPPPGNLVEIAPSQQQQQQQQQQILPSSPSIRPPHVSPPSQSSQLSPDMYANLLNKAELVIQGDLLAMTQNWTPQECEAQRRLVRFHRDQDNNKRVICRFDPVATDDGIVISCIYWKDNDDYYITSVDCIYLLESLIGVTFTVEEKNRVRRNLEGFKPLTVSKLKPSSASFFKLIMAFPNPKPRNIEKDVKIFPWSILETALKKIISKYTASYSSTASVLS